MSGESVKATRAPIVNVDISRVDGLPSEAADLARHLRERIEGEVRFDRASRGAYARDASNYRSPPIGVVVPRTAEDVVEAVAVCRAHDVPILGRGGGTSLAGQCCNVAVVIDFSKYLNRVVDLDVDGRTAEVEPGIVPDDLNRIVRPHGLVHGPDPSTHASCTIGGMIGNNACGVHALMSGRMSDNVDELEILTYDGELLRVGPTSQEELERLSAAAGRTGEIYRGLAELRDDFGDLVRERFPAIPRRVSGFNLDELLPENGFHVARALVGSESTCALVLRAKVRLIENPAARSLVLLGYPDIFRAADHVPEILEFEPIGLEGLDGALIHEGRLEGVGSDLLALLPEGSGYLMVEFGAESHGAAEQRAQEMIEALGRHDGAPDMSLFEDPAQAARIWKIREAGLAAAARTPEGADAWPGWEDSAVAPERLGGYLRDLQALFDAYELRGPMYGHFGEGCVHARLTFDLRTSHGVSRYRAFAGEAAELVTRHGGSLSGEHGDGQARGELLETMYGSELVDAFSRFKAIWDPSGKMNPGKVVDPRPLDADLALRVSERPLDLSTHFAFPDDQDGFRGATTRCVGVGKCRKEESGTMCPSYMVTRDEVHSTRGRARLLHEMLNGEIVDGGWRSDAVAEALDLCLACKACSQECPVNVDMATYKAEFLSHHYAGRVRPGAHYSVGLLPVWARMASKTPGLVNALTQTRGIASVFKRLGGVEGRRPLPRFASRTFREWFDGREPARRHGPEVILWPDTFTEHFQPEVGRAAVEVLEHAGFRVRIPSAKLCCGLPMITTGMLKTAKRFLGRTVDQLRDDVVAGVPVVGLEPSCTAVFRHDLDQLLPHDEDARRLSEQTHTLGEFLAGARWAPPALERNAIVQGHCHQNAVMGMDADRSVMESVGLGADVLDSGCCGMAGSFGFEPGHYDVSMACGERALFPAVREAAPQTLVVADGFSCRLQIAEGTDRRALHLAQVLDLAVRQQEGEELPARYPEHAVSARATTEPSQRDGRATKIVAGGAAVAAGGLVMRKFRSRG